MERNLWVFKPISIKHAINLCNVDKFSCFSFSNKGFIGHLKASKDWDVNSPNFMKELLEKIDKTILNESVAEIIREDKFNLLEEKKRPWSRKRTRAPFYYRAREKSKLNSFKAALQLSEKVIERLGSPWKKAKKGRPPRYCPKKLANVLLVKHYSSFSFEELKAKLEEIRYDCRQDCKFKEDPPIPSKSELHWALKKIPLKYLEEAMRVLDDWAVELHKEIFGADELNKFGVDGTESTCVEFEEYIYGLKKGLRHSINKINALIRLVTNTFCEVNTSKKENQRDLVKILGKRKKSNRSIKNLEIYGDGAYDSEKNYEIVFYNDSDLMARPNATTIEKTRGFFRKKARADFSFRKYKTRKKVERPFGNTTLRDGNKLWYKRPDMRQKGKILRFIAHNMKAYYIQESWAKVFKKFSRKEKIFQIIKTTK